MNKSIPALIFPVREIREKEGLTASLSVSAVDGLEAPSEHGRLTGSVSVQLEFSVGGNRILLQAQAQGRWIVACSRCLAEHPVDVSAAIDETYPLDQETIDLSEDLRQSLLLEVPQRSLCGSGCKGLCPRCGENLNEGPCGCAAKPPSPFGALKNLKENN